jgi:RNA polymerase sigma factor (sigma-70 family)
MQGALLYDISSEIQQWLKSYEPLEPEEEQLLFRRYDLAMSLLASTLVRRVKKEFGVTIRRKKPGEAIAAYIRYVSAKLNRSYEEVWQMLWEGKDDLPEADRAVIEEAERIREKLFNHNLRLVAAVLAKFPKFEGMQFEDLFYEGVIGLGKAIDHYSVNEGTKFSTIAIWWIHQEIGRKLLNYSHRHGGIRFSTRLLDRWSRLRRFLAERGIDILKLSDEEFIDLLQEMSLSKDDYGLLAGPTLISLQQPPDMDRRLTADDDEAMMEEILDIEWADEDEVEEDVLRRERSRILRQLLESLPERERRALMLYCGFEDKECAGSFLAVGKKMGISRQRAMQLVRRAAERLRNHPLCQGLR